MKKRIILHNGVEIPPIILSTNNMGYTELKKVILSGLQIGYRAFDTARDYHNEHIVGQVLNECLYELGLQRKDIFITTKIGNNQQEKGNIEEQIDISLHNLQTDYIDCWMMHWPYPDYYIDTYHKMENIYKTGKVHSIGVANFRLRHFRKLWDDGIEIVPHCVQFEHHPLRAAKDIFTFCHKNDIAIQAYSPLCRMIPAITNSPILSSISTRLKKTIAQVIIRWHYQHGSIPCFFSTNPERIKENYSIEDFNLSDEDMNRINSMDEDYKYHLESASCPGY
jgi:diketogulonate reductase-like aldo/keto reductase